MCLTEMEVLLRVNGGINGGIKPKNKILRLVVRNAQKKIELPQPTPKLQTPDWIKKQVGKLRAAYKKTPATTTFHAFA